MRAIFYVIIPAVAFALVLVNAFFGHMIFESGDLVLNKYAIYIHLQPEWDSHPRNIIYDVTNSWYRTGDAPGPANATYNENRLQKINGRQFVELKHGFSDCRDEWSPIIYRQAIDAVRHEVDYLYGVQLSANPGISVYPDVENTGHDSGQQAQKIRDGYAQFIPVCTSREKTTYDYSIRTDDVGFDVYFVASQQQAEDFYGGDFGHYGESGCFARNMKSFSGTCDVERGGGLLVIVPDELESSTSKITVNLYERD